MKLYIDIMDDTVEIPRNCLTTICIENKSEFRYALSAFINRDDDCKKYIFSEDNKPIDLSRLCFVYDYFNLSISPAVLKKIYSYAEQCCLKDYYNETTEIQGNLLRFASLVTDILDYDTEYNTDILLPDVFKLLGIKPLFSNEFLTEALLEYMLINAKYAKITTFIFINLRLYFTDEEITLLCADIESYGFTIIDFENLFTFNRLKNERLVVIDNDLCKILD